MHDFLKVACILYNMYISVPNNFGKNVLSTVRCHHEFCARFSIVSTKMYVVRSRLCRAGATELGGPGGPWPLHLLENGLPPVTDWRTLPIKGLDD